LSRLPARKYYFGDLGAGVKIVQFFIITVYANIKTHLSPFTENQGSLRVSAFSICFGPVGHPKMYSHMRTEPKKLYLKIMHTKKTGLALK
jgi:hypothetical protein